MCSAGPRAVPSRLRLPQQEAALAQRARGDPRALQRDRHSSSVDARSRHRQSPILQCKTQAVKWSDHPPLSIVVHPPVVPSVYATSGASGTVTAYALSPLGNVAPRLTLGHGNGLSAPSGIAVDPTGRAYVVNSQANSVSEFDPFATSASGPDIMIAGPATGLDAPAGIARDASGRIYVVSHTSVAEFAAGASGDVKPIATISGPDTGLSGAAAATVTPAGGLWVANPGNNSLTEYAPGASGDAAPIATIRGTATGLNMPVGIGQDEHGNLLVANLSASRSRAMRRRRTATCSLTPRSRAPARA